MVTGRPRTVSFSDEEMVKLGEEMVAFVEKNKKTILHLSEWYTIHKLFTYNQWKTFIQRDSFVPYYEKALKIIGLKYVDKGSNVRDSISQRWQRVYFGDLKDQEDQDADDNELRKAAAAQRETRANAEATAAVLDEIQKNKRKLE